MSTTEPRAAARRSDLDPSSDLDPGPNQAWRRFFACLVGTAAGVLAALYLFVAIIDPFDTLPLSPPWHRVPVASNARYAHPALARSAAFDSAVIGTSTSRLLRPAVLDRALGATHFVNLAMNAATAWEQMQLLGVFLAAHPAPRILLVGLDTAWCGATAAGATGEAPRVTARGFPAWLYQGSRWTGYAHLLNLDALEQSARALAILVGLKRPVYGSDGYTSFVPEDARYDAVRAAAHLAAAAPYLPAGLATGPAPAGPGGWQFPALDRLARQLAGLDAASRVLLFFVPIYAGIQPPPGSPAHALWDACKARAAGLTAGHAGWASADFMIASAITTAPTSYWDPLHTRQPVADRLAGELSALLHGAPAPDARPLNVGPPPDASPTVPPAH